MIEIKDCWLTDKCKKRLKDGKCPEFCIKLFKLNALFDNALMTDPQRKHVNLHLDADEKDRSAFEKLRSIELDIENFVLNGENIFIYSPICGNGKTAWSIRLMQAYFNKIWHKSDISCKGLFINVPRFFLELKNSISNENEYVNHIKKNVLDADIVIWDEVATKSLTVYEHEHLLYMINARIDAKKSNIYTSNLQPYDLNEKLGSRLYSRVINNSTVLEFKGSDKRGMN